MLDPTQIKKDFPILNKEINGKVISVFNYLNFNSDKKISNVHLTSMDGDRSFFNIN